MNYREGDEVVRLKAQLGYLKSKLAKEFPYAAVMVDGKVSHQLPPGMTRHYQPAKCPTRSHQA